jgi:ubiquinone/menaquinone biosynthesis C-methylase UbiE
VDATDKFTGKAQVYMRHRQGYPNACLDDLAKICGLGQGSVVADIGAGTGILTRQLLDRGYAVYAIEPNDDMRHAAENALAGNVRFAFVSGTAENTGLDPHSVDLVTAAQSFHWFDHERFRLECMRILKPDAYAALIWNSRDPKSEINTENADICKRLCPQFNAISAPDCTSRRSCSGSSSGMDYTIGEHTGMILNTTLKVSLGATCRLLTRRRRGLRTVMRLFRR